MTARGAEEKGSENIEAISEINDFFRGKIYVNSSIGEHLNHWKVFSYDHRLQRDYLHT